jgi:hypothetical protein
MAGTMNPANKLAELSVREIRSRYMAGGISQSSLGTEYGVTQTTVRDIIRRRIWKNVW